MSRQCNSQLPQVEWEEKWWEASNWAGMREMGAEKSGIGNDGSAWRETWREAIDYDAVTAEPTVERTAHKWAHDAKVDCSPQSWPGAPIQRGRSVMQLCEITEATDFMFKWHHSFCDGLERRGCACLQIRWAPRAYTYPVQPFS